MEWPACQSRRSVGENDELFICDDPRVRAARRLVARDVCVGCGCRREPLVEQAGDRNAKERARTDPLADAGDQLPSARLAKGDGEASCRLGGRRDDGAAPQAHA